MKRMTLTFTSRHSQSFTSWMHEEDGKLIGVYMGKIMVRLWWTVLLPRRNTELHMLIVDRGMRYDRTIEGMPRNKRACVLAASKFIRDVEDGNVNP